MGHRRLRIAVYHNLPPGGAKRLLYEHLSRSAAVHEYELFRPDLGRANLFADVPDVDRRCDSDVVVPVVHRVAMRTWPTRAPSGLRDAFGAVAVRSVERTIAARIDDGGFDLVLVHPCQFTQAPSLLQLVQPPTLYYLHEPRRRSHDDGYQRAAGWKGVVRRPVDRWLGAGDGRSVAAATTVAVNSAFTAARAQSVYGRQPALCAPGVDRDAFVLGPGDGGYAVAVGALEEVKGHLFTINALGRLPSAVRPPLKIVFERRDPAFEAAVVARSREVGLPLELIWGATEAELIAIYGRAQVTIATSKNEPFGLTVLESAACGTPVVAVNEGGYIETVEPGRNGVVVPREEAAFAAAVAGILHGDCGDRGAVRATTERWGWDGSVRRLLALYADTVAVPR